nr:MAG TPA: YwmB [Caudoviricetes sp.]
MIFSKDKHHCKKTYLYIATPIMGVARVYAV